MLPGPPPPTGEVTTLLVDLASDSIGVPWGNLYPEVPIFSPSRPARRRRGALGVVFALTVLLLLGMWAGTQHLTVSSTRSRVQAASARRRALAAALAVADQGRRLLLPPVPRAPRGGPQELGVERSWRAELDPAADHRTPGSGWRSATSKASPGSRNQPLRGTTWTAVP